MQAQPYRTGARTPSPALDAMLAGGSTPTPGASVIAGAQSNAAPRATGGKTVLVPRVSAPRRNLRAKWPARTRI